MTPFVILTTPGSPFARSALAAAIETSAPFSVEAIPPGQHKTAAHLALHPFGNMPVLKHGDFTLYETQAILRYIDRVRGGRLTPSDPKRAARMDQAMNVNDCYLFRGCSDVIGFQRIVGPQLMGLTPDEHAISAAMPHAYAVFNELGRLLGAQAYFAGDQVSLADLMIVSQLDMLSMTPEWNALSRANERLVKWLARMRTRPSVAKTDWAHVAGYAAQGGVQQIA